MARTRRLRRIPGATALVVAFISGAAGAGLVAGGVLLADAQHVAERSASSQVLTVTGCDRNDCSYGVAYMDAQGNYELAHIWASIGEPGDGSTTTIYYQVAHPDVARVPRLRLPGRHG